MRTSSQIILALILALIVTIAITNPAIVNATIDTGKSLLGLKDDTTSVDTSMQKTQDPNTGSTGQSRSIIDTQQTNNPGTSNPNGLQIGVDVIFNIAGLQAAIVGFLVFVIILGGIRSVNSWTTKKTE